MGSRVSESQERLRVSGLSKRFGAQVALRNVDFRLEAGEILAVVGQNGAGKSTLAKILAGALQPDRGDLWIDGASAKLNTPRGALKAGVAYIPQEPSYLPLMTVAENILLGRWPSRFGMTSNTRILREGRRVVRQFDIHMDVTRPIGALPLADRQLAEILKALGHTAKILVLDEPTAALTSSESNNLFRVVRKLASTGVAVILISHRLDEIFDISDTVLVLRNGRVVANRPSRDLSRHDLIGLMVGADIAGSEFDAAEEREVQPSRKPRLRLRMWTRRGLPDIEDFSLELFEGEILGIYGQRGAGGHLIAEGIAGRLGGFTGEVEVDGKVRPPFVSPREAKDSGIGYVPVDRKREGLFPEMSVSANIVLMSALDVSRVGVLRRRIEKATAKSWQEKLQMRFRTTDQAVASLSGGNQQKVVLASRLALQPSVLVLNEPTRGVDVGARAEIHGYLHELSRTGWSIIWVTSDVEEAAIVSDRLIVMRDGRSVGELAGRQNDTEARALALATKE